MKESAETPAYEASQHTRRFLAQALRKKTPKIPPAEQQGGQPKETADDDQGSGN